MILEKIEILEGEYGEKVKNYLLIKKGTSEVLLNSNDIKKLNMSGGKFDYKQYTIKDIKEDLEECLKKEVSLSPKVKEVIKKSIITLNLAEIYINKLDFFLSGDIGEEEFLSSLKEELDGMENC
jgi:bacterioferritin (cytochrome b1)